MYGLCLVCVRPVLPFNIDVPGPQKARTICELDNIYTQKNPIGIGTGGKMALRFAYNVKVRFLQKTRM